MLSKHIKEVAREREEKIPTFYPWEQLYSQLQKHTEKYLNSDDLIALSQTSRKYRQSIKEELLKRLFPEDLAIAEYLASVVRVQTPDQKIDFVKVFKSAYQRDIVKTQYNYFGKWTKYKSHARHARLIKLCKENRVAEIKNEKPAITLDDIHNIADGQGLILFYWLVVRGHQEILNYFYEKLLKWFPEKAGINHQLEEFSYFTLLHCAAYFGQMDAVNTILATQEANIDLRNRSGLTPLWVAAVAGHTDIVKSLLDKKACPHTTNRTGKTPLNMAAEGGHCRVAKLLLERKANINQPNNSGITPLTIAAYRGHYDVVVLLLRHGANITLKGGKGKTAFEWATDPQIKKVLLIAELDLFLQSLPTSDQKFFHKTAASVSQLKKALSDDNFAQVKN